MHSNAMRSYLLITWWLEVTNSRQHAIKNKSIWKEKKINVFSPFFVCFVGILTVKFILQSKSLTNLKRCLALMKTQPQLTPQNLNLFHLYEKLCRQPYYQFPHGRSGSWAKNKSTNSVRSTELVIERFQFRNSIGSSVEMPVASWFNQCTRLWIKSFVNRKRLT